MNAEIRQKVIQKLWMLYDLIEEVRLMHEHLGDSRSGYDARMQSSICTLVNYLLVGKTIPFEDYKWANIKYREYGEEYSRILGKGV